MILYKEGRLKRAVDALSRRGEETVEFVALSRPTWPAWSEVQTSLSTDPVLGKIKTDLEAGRISTLTMSSSMALSFIKVGLSSHPNLTGFPNC